MPATSEIPICILTEKGDMPEELVEVLLKEVPVSFLENDEAIFTRLTDLFNTNRVAFIVKKVQYGNDLTVGEWERAEKLTASFADIFAGSLREVLPVPGAKHTLNIPDGATFHIRVHQRALNPPQLQFLHGKIDEMLTAGIIERAPPDQVKCAATTVLAQKAHKHGGLSLEELQYRVNEQCQQNGMPPVFTLPEQEVTGQTVPQQSDELQKWRILYMPKLQQSQ
jgi:hypothetical protein